MLESKKTQALAALCDNWQQAWPQALALWTRYPRLSPPRWCHTVADEKREKLEHSFAMIRLSDHAVVISLRQVHKLGIGDMALPVLAHEIGHHIYCPANIQDYAAAMAAARYCLPGLESCAPMVLNLYEDLLINERLKNRHHLPMDEVYRRLRSDESTSLFDMYMRCYEILWGLPAASLTVRAVKKSIEYDAQLAARVVQVYANDWMTGAMRFAALCFPYLGGQELEAWFNALADTPHVGSGHTASIPVESNPAEQGGIMHPANDPLVVGETGTPAVIQADADEHGVTPGGQYREPFAYFELLKAMGMTVDQHGAAVMYYRQRARPHLIRFPQVKSRGQTYRQPEGLDTWDSGDPIENLDWFQSALRSTVLVPGYTTVERVYGHVEDWEPGRLAPDLDLYVDCSGSMPNPQVVESPIAIAGAILALSALKAGSAVRATLWSGARQFQSTDGFVRNDIDVLRILTGYLGGATAFPLHMLRDTYTGKPTRPATHIVVLSDDGADTMLQQDELGNAGADICRRAIESAVAGGTLALNVYMPDSERFTAFLSTMHAQGWHSHLVSSWQEVIAFAYEFSRQTFGQQR